MISEQENRQALKALLDEEYKNDIEPERKHVFGEGNLFSPIVFIGEAPGGDEEKEGRPFVGKAGKNLSAFLEKAGVERNDVYITNAVKFRPVNINPKTRKPSNRTPTTREIEKSRSFLLREMALIRPKLVITLGNTPLFSLTSDHNLKIMSVHGQLLDYSNAEYGLSFSLMPFLHPAAVIYRRELLSEYEKDLIKFAEIKNRFI